MSQQPVDLDTGAVLAAMQLSFAQQMTRMTEQINQLVIEKAHLEAYINQLREQRSETPTDPWGDTEKGTQ